MAHSNQANKRIRQGERRRIQNKGIASRMRSDVKRVLTLAESGEKEQAEQLLPSAIRSVDKAMKRHVIHRNTAARKKSLLMRAVNSVGA
ncbi:MAG: 30S ribosomal protein S20 [Planctomycetota bacterium]